MAGAAAAGPPGDDWIGQLQPPDAAARGQVYLLTLSRLLPETLAGAQGGLRDLAGVTKEQLAECVADAFNNPERDGRAGRPVERQTPIVRKVVVVSELHADGTPHLHAAVLLGGSTRWAAAKRTLRSRHQLAAHFSLSHREWWSALRYLTHTTSKKLEVDGDRTARLAPGESFDAFKESQQPFNASAWRAKREKRDMEAAAEGASTVFTKLDFNALVLSESLDTRAKVLAYVQDHGNDSMRLFMTKHQRDLTRFLKEAAEWGDAKKVAADEALTDWALLCQTADKACPHGCACNYHRCSEEVLNNNGSNWDRKRLAAALRNIIITGPTKDTRVPFLVGKTNTGKSTLVDPFDVLFGHNSVFHLPSITDERFALSNWCKNKRFVYWDEFSPVEYADQGVLPATTFKKAFGGKYFEVQRAQNWHDGNDDFRWQRGAVFTNKAVELWAPTENVSLEDIQHMQSRVEMFPCTHVVKRPGTVGVQDGEERAVHMARWIRDGAVAYDAAQVLDRGPLPAAPSGAAASSSTGAVGVTDLDQFFDAAQLPTDVREALTRDVVAAGAVHVQELTRQDWESLESWQLLRPLQQRRVLKFVPP